MVNTNFKLSSCQEETTNAVWDDDNGEMLTNQEDRDEELEPKLSFHEEKFAFAKAITRGGEEKEW